MFLRESSICLVTVSHTCSILSGKTEQHRGHHWTILDLVLKANIFHFSIILP
jgi:hypothetical protein